LTLATGTSTSRIDKGRFALTGKEEDEYVFRVPMLRNVAKTAPYFHDGSVQDLLQAIQVMGEVQLGVELPDDTVKKIAEFLETLGGEVPAHFSDPARGSLQ
jgi:cytochrome c peroxidase